MSAWSEENILQTARGGGYSLHRPSPALPACQPVQPKLLSQTGRGTEEPQTHTTGVAPLPIHPPTNLQCKVRGLPYKAAEGLLLAWNILKFLLGFSFQPSSLPSLPQNDFQWELAGRPSWAKMSSHWGSSRMLQVERYFPLNQRERNI